MDSRSGLRSGGRARRKAELIPIASSTLFRPTKDVSRSYAGPGWPAFAPVGAVRRKQSPWPWALKLGRWARS